MAAFTQETATARLARLLTMVPWLLNRQGIDVQQAADDLGVSVDQLEADLNLLFLCGYGQMPDELCRGFALGAGERLDARKECLIRQRDRCGRSRARDQVSRRASGNRCSNPRQR